MKILCVTDSLNSGGAQRQIVAIASGLAKKGHLVKVLIFHDITFFKSTLDVAGVEVILLQFKNKLGRFKALRASIIHEKPDSILSFMNVANTLNELVRVSLSFTNLNYRLIVSERRGFSGRLNLNERTRIRLHCLADGVVANSNRASKFLAENVPMVKGKLRTIYNIVNFDEFTFSTKHYKTPINVVVVANYRTEKNIEFLINSVEKLTNEGGLGFVINWYGNTFFHNNKPTIQSEVFLNAQNLIIKKKLTEVVKLHGLQRSLAPIYKEASALCLTSSFEGLPNVVCEAMASGCAILTSDVSDVRNFINHKTDGYIFDLSDENSLCDAFKWLVSRTHNELEIIALRNFEKAGKLFSSEMIIDQFEQEFIKR